MLVSGGFVFLSVGCLSYYQTFIMKNKDEDGSGLLKD
jgi:hypothetical protein